MTSIIPTEGISKSLIIFYLLKTTNTTISERTILIFLLGLWGIVQYGLFRYYGFVTSFEGKKYQHDALSFLATGKLSDLRFFYSAYTLIIALFIKLRLSLKLIIILQLSINLWATFRFYRLAQTLVKQPLIAALSTSILILSFPIQQWNFYLYTESLFTSLTILFAYHILLFKFTKIVDYLIISILLFLLSFLRPTGILLAIPLIIYLFLNRNQLKLHKLQSAIPALTLAILIAFNIVFNTGHLIEYTHLALQKSWIVWGEKYFQHNHNSYSFLGFMEIIILRSLYFFSMLRVHYSNFHNLLLMSFYPIYLFALAGIYPLWKSSKTVFLFIVTIIIVFSSFSILTFINWQGRFMVPILPFIILLAGYGFRSILSIKKK